MYTYIQKNAEVNAVICQIRVQHERAGAARQLKAMLDFCKDHVGKIGFNNSHALYLVSAIFRASEFYGMPSYIKEPKHRAEVERIIFSMFKLVDKEIEYCKENIRFSRREAMDFDLSRLEEKRLRLLRTNEIAGLTAKLARQYFGEQSGTYLDQLIKANQVSAQIAEYGDEYSRFFAEITDSKTEINHLLARALPSVLRSIAKFAAHDLMQLTNRQITSHGWNKCLQSHNLSEITEQYSETIPPDLEVRGDLLLEDTVILKVGAFGLRPIRLDEPTPRANNEKELADAITQQLLAKLPKKRLNAGSLDRNTAFYADVDVLIHFGDDEWARLHCRPHLMVNQTKAKH